MDNIITSSSIFLFRSLDKMNRLKIETDRRSLVLYSLLKSGFIPATPLISNTIKYLEKDIHEDGAFRSNISNAIMSLCYQYIDKKKSDAINKYLIDVQNEDGGWGFYPRDNSRIPVTSRVLMALVGGKNNALRTGFRWIEKEWKKDIDNEAALSYKGAFYLIACGENNIKKNELITKTISYLISIQNRDGGWGPHKSSLVGSVPSYTALAVLGLLKYSNEDSIIKGIVNLTKSFSKSTGQWKEHPFDNSSWCLLALNEFRERSI